MRYRAVANGNIVDDVPQSLVAAGIYVPVDDDGAELEETPTPAPPSAPEGQSPVEQPAGPVKPMGTRDMPRPPHRGKHRR